MTTSAQSLNQLLTIANGHRPETDRFISVIAEYLGIGGPNAEPEVILRIYLLVSKIESDIESLPIDESSKQLARTHLAPFMGLKSFAHFPQNIKQSKQNFLHPQHLVGLTNLHMAISGHIKSGDLDKTTKKLSAKFHEMRDEVASSVLPDQAKRVLLKRLGQISSILEHFDVFGAEALQEEVEALVGAIVVNQQKCGKSNSGIFRKLAKITGTLLLVLKGADVGLDSALSIAENGPALIEVTQELFHPKE